MRAVRLLGVRAVIKGISPVLAQKMVAFGADLSGVVTMVTLRDALCAVSPPGAAGAVRT